MAAKPAELYYNLLLGTDGRPASLAGGYWDVNFPQGAGAPIVPADWFAPSLAVPTPADAAVVDVS